MLERRDPLDEALDDALATYGVALENKELEQKIVARVAEQARRARTMHWLAASIAAAAIVLIGCFLGWTRRTPPIEAPAADAIARAVVSVPLRQMLGPKVAVKRRASHKRTAAPKLSRFPAPAPMTKEEQALIRLVASAAKNPSLRLDPFSGTIKPIRITAIDIKPLGWER